MEILYICKEIKVNVSPALNNRAGQLMERVQEANDVTQSGIPGNGWEACCHFLSIEGDGKEAVVESHAYKSL